MSSRYDFAISGEASRFLFGSTARIRALLPTTMGAVSGVAAGLMASATLAPIRPADCLLLHIQGRDGRLCDPGQPRSAVLHTVQV